MLRRTALAVALLGVLVVPGSAGAQVGFTAVAGGYLPANDLFDSIRLGGETGPVILNLGQKPALTFGGRLSYWRSRLAVEAELLYAISGLDIPASGLAPDNAPVVFGSLNLIYVIFQAPFSPLSLYVTGGAGFVNRGGDFLDEFEGTSDVAGILGMGLSYGLGPDTRLRFDLRDYISSFAPTGRGFQFDSKLQNDIFATLGLEVIFGSSP